MIRKEIESLFKTHYTQMYRLALTLLFDEAESKDVVSDVFASLLSGTVLMRADNAKALLLASVHHRCLNVLQHKQVQERFARLLTEDTDTLIDDSTVDEQMQMEELMHYVRDNLSPLEQNMINPWQFVLNTNITNESRMKNAVINGIFRKKKLQACHCCRIVLSSHH